MKKLKVLMLTSSYPIEGSNLGPFVKNIVKALISKNVEVGVMIFSTTKKYREYEQDGARIYEYPYTFIFPPRLHKNMGLIPSIKSSFFAKLELMGYFFSTRKYLVKICKKYDIVHAHWLLPSGLIACTLKNKIKKPIITTAWGGEFHLPKYFFIKNILNYVNRKSDSVITVSKYMLTKARDYDLDTSRMKVISNSIDVDQFSLKRKKSNKIIIGTARRLVPEKRIKDLIEAISLLSERNKKKLELWIIGDGPERKKLELMIRNKDMSKMTKFCGMINHDRMPSILSKIDIHVNPSVQEGMATANLESMAAGCCAIATEGYGNDEVIINNITGKLYKPRDVKSLSTILEDLLNNPKKMEKLAKKGKQFVNKNFNSKKIVNEYIKEYNSMHQ